MDTITSVIEEFTADREAQGLSRNTINACGNALTRFQEYCTQQNLQDIHELEGPFLRGCATCTALTLQVASPGAMLAFRSIE